jgi:hypothetical protein
MRWECSLHRVTRNTYKVLDGNTLAKLIRKTEKRWKIGGREMVFED